MQGDVRERRAAPRYPIHVPIRLRAPEREEIHSHAGDLSSGGLSFDSPEWLPEGIPVEVELPIQDQRVTLRGKLLPARVSGEGTWRVAVRFDEPDTRFRMKLAEQILRIHELQRELTELRGEHVSTEEAADEWIRRYAAEFAELYA